MHKEIKFILIIGLSLACVLSFTPNIFARDYEYVSTDDTYTPSQTNSSDGPTTCQGVANGVGKVWPWLGQTINEKVCGIPQVQPAQPQVDTLEIRPLPTYKIPDHILTALDLTASEMGYDRSQWGTFNNTDLDIHKQYQAYSDYYSGDSLGRSCSVPKDTWVTFGFAEKNSKTFGFKVFGTQNDPVNTQCVEVWATGLVKKGEMWYHIFPKELLLQGAPQESGLRQTVTQQVDIPEITITPIQIPDIQPFKHNSVQEVAIAKSPYASICNNINFGNGEIIQGRGLPQSILCLPPQDAGFDQSRVYGINPETDVILDITYYNNERYIAYYGRGGNELKPLELYYTNQGDFIMRNGEVLMKPNYNPYYSIAPLYSDSARYVDLWPRYEPISSQ